LLEALIYTNATQANQPGLPSTGSMETLVIFLAIIAIIVARRIARGIYGRRYSTGRVLFLPVFYVLLTLVFVIFLNLGDTDIYYTLLLIPAGAVVGLRIGGGISFFMKNGEVYYRRSPAILIIWLASYVSRILLEVLYPTNRTIAFAVDVVLALTAGLIIGEAVHLIQGRRSFNPAPEKEEDRFVINQ